MRLAVALLFSLVGTVIAQNAAGPVREEMYVTVGGIEQWVTIRGEDRSNPVVLFLHGGPGDAMSPFADAMFAGWDKEFTLVQWDQRGAGRTFGKNGPSLQGAMTVEQMVRDGVQVSEFLRQHLGKKKIILAGNSWGTILGIHMAHARPDLFHAYIGAAQLVDTQKGWSASYERVLQFARACGNEQAITELTAIGPPPWNAVKQWPVYRKWERAYQPKLVTATPAPETMSAAYASPQEREQYEAADDFSFEQFWGMTLAGPLTQVDLAKLGRDFFIPIFIFQGQEDLTALPELAKAYFDSIKAPRKEFYLVPGTGHGMSTAELNLMRKVLIEEVGPLAVEH